MSFTKRIPLKERFWQKVNLPFDATINECWNWIGAIQSDGYGSICEGGRHGKSLSAHIVAHRLYKGHEGNFHVLHKCDNRRCVNPSHLFLGTNNQNCLDRNKKGRMTNADVKLTFEIAELIRKSTLNKHHLAMVYAVDIRTIERILNNEIWKPERFV